jgi:hypothetical protein
VKAAISGCAYTATASSSCLRPSSRCNPLAFKKNQLLDSSFLALQKSGLYSWCRFDTSYGSVRSHIRNSSLSESSKQVSGSCEPHYCFLPLDSGLFFIQCLLTFIYIWFFARNLVLDDLAIGAAAFWISLRAASIMIYSSSVILGAPICIPVSCMTQFLLPHTWSSHNSWLSDEHSSWPAWPNIRALQSHVARQPGELNIY